MIVTLDPVAHRPFTQQSGRPSALKGTPALYQSRCRCFFYPCNPSSSAVVSSSIRAIRQLLPLLLLLFVQSV